MRVLESWLRLPRARASNRAIDMGGGRQIAPEDVLESHFRRLAMPAPALAAQEVNIQVAPNMSTAIRVVAPTLAPLTQLAEELGKRVTSVQPAPDFRSELHQALEEAHRRQAAGRSLLLETRRRRRLPWLLASGIAAVGLAGVALWLLRREKTR